MKADHNQVPREETTSTPWRRPGPGVASARFAAIATSVLVFAASHVRVDRTRRQPLVSWVGPAAAWVEYLAMLGWLLTLVALFLSSRAMEQKGRQYVYGELGLILGIINVPGSCLFYGAVYED